MRMLAASFCCAVIAISATDGAAQVAPTRWDHNGSQVSLSAEGPRRQFHYQVPADHLLPLGVLPGTLLFDGRRNGNQYSGTAYVFSKLCGALPYAVASPVSPDQRTVTMYGKAPIVDSSCRAVEYRDDDLFFNLVEPIETRTNQDYADRTTAQTTSSQPVGDDGYTRFLQQWTICLDSARPNKDIDSVITMCDAALAFPQIAPRDRTRLLERRAALSQYREELARRPVVPWEQTIGGTATTANPSVPNTDAPRKGDVDKIIRSFDSMSLVIIAVGVILCVIAIIASLWRRPASTVTDAISHVLCAKI
jgi:hypothetical protein